HVRGDRDRQPLADGRTRRRRRRGDRRDRVAAGAVAVRLGRLVMGATRARSHGLKTMAPERTRRRRSVRSRPGSQQNGRPTTAAELRDNVRERLIESRLTPNSISVTGLALNVAAAVLVTQRLFFLAGVSFIVGSIMDTLDGRYSRMSGKGTPFGAFLDSTLDRIEEGVVLTAVAA